LRLATSEHGVTTFAVLWFILISREGRENRPQLRCGNASQPRTTSQLAAWESQLGRELWRRRGEGGAAWVAQDLRSPNICLGMLTRSPRLREVLAKTSSQNEA
jgi:hypothetical protein